MSSSETLIPTDDEQEIARNSSRLLISGSMELHMRGSAAEREVVVRVPERIAHVFQHIFLQLAQGKGVTIIPNEALLTTQDAADFLHVSRPFLIKLLTKHNVRIQKVGNRRKVSFEEVKKLQETLKAQSRDALNELEQLDQELGLE
jgi:excisionase family DNA binding protein